VGIANDADAVNNAIKEPAPELSSPEKVIVELQRGLVDPNTGIWYTDAEVREMTGADEEYMAGLESKSTLTYAEYMSSLIKRTVVRVGQMSTSDNPSVLDALTIGDRDILFLGVIRATYGRTKSFQAQCGNCEKLNDVTVDLEEDFPLLEPNVDLRSTLDVKIRNGETIKLRIPTAADNAFAAKVSKSVAEQNSAMLAKCRVWENGETQAQADSWAKGLNLGDRNTLIKSLTSIKAGPKLGEVDVPCAHCGHDMTIRIDWISLLLS